MSKHTPGPWKRDEYGDITNPAGQRVNFRGVSTLMSSIEERMAEAEANTALLIAAPELLDALRAAEDWITVASRPPASLTLAIIRAAIAKAEGKQ